MLLKTSTLSTRQALIVGQISDALSGRPTLTRPAITLTYQGDPSRIYPLISNLEPNGVFSFNGDSGRAFAPLPGGAALDLRLTATAPGYETAVFNFSLSADDLALTSQERLVGGQTITVDLYDAPLIDHELALTPEPVHLSGQVVAVDDGTAVAGAAVEVTAPQSRPAVLTDGSGFFTIQNLPVALEVTVQVTHPDFETLTTAILLDYSQPVNQRKFALTSD